ncbi:MAG: hypothetical protein IJ435_02045 [Clostridia bacterium]|nr:hypothetical protein [Clostridia bacterium]
MSDIILSLSLVLAVIFVIVFLVFKSDNVTLICKDLSSLIDDEDCVIKIKICKRRKGNYGKRND